jgi:hypothetical protein
VPGGHGAPPPPGSLRRVGSATSCSTASAASRP